LSADIVFDGGKDVTPLFLTVETPAKCRGADSLNIKVHEGNFATLTPLDTGICPRAPIHFTAAGGVKYEWTPDLFLSDPSAPDPVANPVTSVEYTMIATDQFGCTDTLKAEVIVHPDAVLDMDGPFTIYPGESVQMNAYGNTLYFKWFPPLGLTSTTIANPVASPEVNTRYFVTGVTEFGCAVRDSVDVYVESETILDIPNAFSPGSQPNSEIKIIKRGIASLKYFRIFNRWGQMLFETKDINQGWDGQFKGKAQPLGVYVYMVEAVTNTGKKFTKQGNITLIR
jgi:gliding motility-associated-like protein